MSFNGFTPETSAFLWDLMFHNERPWFEEHREQFLRCLKEPFDAMARETRSLMEEKYPESSFSVHISRIYRDARRLFGRGPYKDHLWFTLWDENGAKGGPAFWFEVSAHKFGYGVGFWDVSTDQLEAYRRYIDTNPAHVERLAQAILAQDRFSLYGEDYKRPKGDKGELLNPWYNKKSLGLECTRDFGGDVLSAELPQIVADGFSFLMPYYRFFTRFRQEEE